MNWYSTKLRFFLLVEPVGFAMARNGVFLLRADSFEAARLKALELGAAQEELFLNADGANAKWCFESILTLDVLPDELENAEVCSEFCDGLQTDIEWGHEFSPEDSEPSQSI